MSVDQGRRHAGLVPNRTPETVRARYDRATADLDPPLALVDLGAFDRNAADMTRRAAGRPVRVATKSLRCRFLIERALATPGYRGVMCYSLAEALWLHAAGTSDAVNRTAAVKRESLTSVFIETSPCRLLNLIKDSCW